MEGLKNFIKIGGDLYELAKGNYKISLAIPVFLGGFWQFFELITMGFPYGRYFSVTQLLADGILILLFFTLIIIATLLLIIVIDVINKWKIKFDKKDKNDFIQIILFILICMSIMVIAFGLLLLFYRPVPDLITVGFVFLAFLSFSILFVPMVYYVEKIKKYLSNRRTESEKKKSVNKLTLYSYSFCFLILFSYVMLFLLHDFFLKPSNLDNFRLVYCLVDNEYPNNAEKNIRYYNDKFIFVEVFISKDNKVIKKYEYKEIFNSETCINSEK